MSNSAGRPEPGKQANRHRPLNPIARAVLLFLGTVALAVGVIGIYVPGLPTTPFLLLAAACYARSSERLFYWLVHDPRIGPTLNTLLKEKAIPLKVKVLSLVVAWAVLGSLALFVVTSLWLKGLLLALVLVETIFMLSVKTARS